MPEARLTLIGGGARSGKSAFALKLARERGRRRVLIATAQPLDREMRARIERHRRERGADFRTIESPLELDAELDALRDADVAVVDCLTLWLSNLMLAGHGEGDVHARIDALAASIATCACPLLIVTNEVGMGVVPESALGRAFRDLTGRAHQQLARAADEVYLAVLGTVVRLHPAPLALADRSRP